MSPKQELGNEVIKLDLYIPPLLEIDSELSALDYHLNLIENQIRNKEAFERILSQRKIMKFGLTSKDPEWHDERYELDYIVEFLLPRLFRGPFLISLYTVYESAVTEIANLIQNQKRIEIPITDRNRNFNLDRAKKYYKDTIDFQLYSNNVAWQRIKMLSVLRNAIAHGNGRIEMLSEKKIKQIITWEKQNVGISSIGGFVIFEERFLRDTLGLVSESLNDLVERYKKWDHNKTTL